MRSQGSKEGVKCINSIRQWSNCRLLLASYSIGSLHGDRPMWHHFRHRGSARSRPPNRCLTTRAQSSRGFPGSEGCCPWINKTGERLPSKSQNLSQRQRTQKQKRTNKHTNMKHKHKANKRKNTKKHTHTHTQTQTHKHENANTKTQEHKHKPTRTQTSTQTRKQLLRLNKSWTLCKFYIFARPFPP